MKLKFKVQSYPTNAVESVVDCFAGQPLVMGTSYRIAGNRQEVRELGEAYQKRFGRRLP